MFRRLASRLVDFAHIVHLTPASAATATATLSWLPDSHRFLARQPTPTLAVYHAPEDGVLDSAHAVKLRTVVRDTRSDVVLTSQVQSTSARVRLCVVLTRPSASVCVPGILTSGCAADVTYPRAWNATDPVDEAVRPQP